ncbi:phosphoglycerate mutase (2,3-diphosphoglycerate-independent) [Candidatus Woesebacteria bacterium GWC1_42_13]|uniref:2,3-bisphosphoglycerate-independent phosphoglycerate mutase n=1 Tax=Candidatus Woesebacteria bacterium GWC1_42_13 TaxID=1802475 RepID=A0A1F7WWD4_9BACT|nr:MAG: phosphoglycerate mutase (2,3-diphosphoglycerate-independent) [Candidatus Woesebacteria bacterium GWC1_42_13]
MFNLPFLKPVKLGGNKITPWVLLVLDGWGIAPPSEGNAITKAKTPNMTALLGKYPHTQLIASGESVGLPANEVGNTEVGHLTMGAGRVIYQDLKRINIEIEEGTFFENRAFLAALNHSKRFNSKLHIMGLVGTGNVHSSIEHFYALLNFCEKYEVRGVKLHLFTDGRDTPPQEAEVEIAKIDEYLHEAKFAEIATISGRYYAMDRDRRWDRTEKAYKAIVAGKGVTARSAIEAVKGAYAKSLTDEFIEPTVIVNAEGRPVGTVDNGDAVIFFNFRVDRVRQLTMAFVLAEFEKLTSFEFGYAPGTELEEGKATFARTFNREKWPQNLLFVTMTEYHKKLPVSAIAYGPIVVENSLGDVLSRANIRQMHMAESEKERFVTYYFDGMREIRVPGEDVLIVPSPKIATYDKKPEMSVFKLVGEFRKELAKDIYHFFLINFANPDMVAHTGNLKASIAAVEAADKAVGEILEMVKVVNGNLVITADHGNAEELISFPTTSFFFTSSEGGVNTEHSNNPVPVIFVVPSMEGRVINLPQGALSDIAPTILNLMGLTPPTSMKGRNLFQGA